MYFCLVTRVTAMFTIILLMLLEAKIKLVNCDLNLHKGYHVTVKILYFLLALGKVDVIVMAQKERSSESGSEYVCNKTAVSEHEFDHFTLHFCCINLS